PKTYQIDQQIPEPEVDISIIIPAYNEERRLPQTLHSIVQYFDGRSGSYEVIVVDDGSADRTASVVEEFSRSHPEVSVVGYGENRGKGYAVRFGILRARGTKILYDDADGASPIAEIERLEKALEGGADVAIGSRAMFSQDTQVSTNLLRKVLGRTFNGFVNFVILPGIADTQCGFKLFARPVAYYLFSRARADRFSFDVEILFLARKSGCRIAEVPINWTNVPGSKVNLLTDSLRMLKDIFVFRSREISGIYQLKKIVPEPTT
ncbi:MAG: glycosyltransferase family 2 protein, partial [Bdellovibrionales bacterium]|nr:glycosyltransferase family 2 protein [Bdellovibrionales bacterium]